MISINNKQKILVVEDDVHIRSNVVEFLLIHEFDVISASNGIEGLACYESFKPDLIICDIMMPEMDGYTFLEELQRRFPLNLSIFIFLTAKNSQADQRKGMNLGADDYIIKPFTFVELLETIQKKIERHAIKVKSFEKVVEKVNKQANPTPYHEFNTCLSSILTGSQLLLGNPDSLQNDIETRPILDIINRSGLRLSKAINNFILNNELSAKKYFPFTEEVPASFIANTIVQVAASYNRSSDLVLSIEGNAMPSDRFLLKRILEELADNAFKFSSAGEVVSWDIFLLPRGAKIDVEYGNKSKFNREKFENVAPYEQFATGNNIVEGLGLGLNLVKEIVSVLSAELYYVDANPGLNRFQVSFRYPNQNNLA